MLPGPDNYKLSPPHRSATTPEGRHCLALRSLRWAAADFGSLRFFGWTKVLRFFKVFGFWGVLVFSLRFLVWFCFNYSLWSFTIPFSGIWQLVFLRTLSITEAECPFLIKVGTIQLDGKGGCVMFPCPVRFVVLPCYDGLRQLLCSLSMSGTNYTLTIILGRLSPFPGHFGGLRK